MTIGIGILLGILAVLLVRRFLVPRLFVGEQLFAVKATAEAGYKRLHPDSLLPVIGFAWLLFGIYLFVWREWVHKDLQALIHVVEMPESLRQVLLGLSVAQWAMVGLAITASYLAWLRVLVKHKRKLILGSKGIAVDGAIVLWSEMAQVVIDKQRIGFTAGKRAHLYSCTLSPGDLQLLKGINFRG